MLDRGRPRTCDRPHDRPRRPPVLRSRAAREGEPAARAAVRDPAARVDDRSAACENGQLGVGVTRPLLGEYGGGLLPYALEPLGDRAPHGGPLRHRMLPPTPCTYI
ncbi:hypothetical protein GCM10010446_13820 [Streptomyces enissocaesilis]|uniref:Uncharacterized protein n=1 Tax=Streptomyces enissocaesilis TaxID=332589 RepID=A0ABP6JEB9_9ACTN